MTLKDCDGCLVKAELAWYKKNYIGMKTRTEIEKELASIEHVRGWDWSQRYLRWVLTDARTELLQKLAKIEMERSEIKQKIEDLDRNLEKCEIKKLVPFPCGCRFTKDFYEGVCNAGGICENIISSETDGKGGYYLRVHDQNKCLICIEREAKHDRGGVNES